MNSDERAELIAEFELLQGKIDKVGDFAFRVKAWSISLTTAIVVGSVSGKIEPRAVWVALVGIAGFWLVALNQSAWKEAFQERCREIDDALRLDAIRRNPLSASTWARAITKGPPQSLIHAINLKSKSLQGNLFGKLILRATTIFYAGQAVLVVAVAAYLAQTEQLDDVPKEISVEGPVTVTVNTKSDTPIPQNTSPVTNATVHDKRNVGTSKTRVLNSGGRNDESQ